MIPRQLRDRAAAQHRAARMNELARVIRAEGDGRGYEHRDGYTTTERSWQPEAHHLHIGFRPE